MQLVVFAIILFLITICIHLIIWRIQLPKKQTKALVIIFFGFLFMLICVECVSQLLFDHMFFNLAQWFHISLFHIAMSFSYIITYSGIEEDSPTLCLLRYVANSGHQGRTTEDLKTFLTEASIIDKRIQSALNSKLIVKKCNLFQLTAKGQRWAKLFKTAQTIWGMRMGG